MKYFASVTIDINIEAESEDEARDKIETLLFPIEKRGGYIGPIEVMGGEEQL